MKEEIKRKIKSKKERGITLIALVITIIVLLILAGVSIAMLTGQNGILTQANKSKTEQSHGAVKEAISLAYNEWQIEVNTGSRTKLASTETVIINGKEEKAKAETEETFLQFLESKGYIKEETTDVLNVEKLTGSKQALGNGETTDIYKIELKDGNYEVNYYGESGETRNIWSIASKDDSQESATLEPDTGKEALILVYRVRPGDTIELPYYATYYDGGNGYPANFDFTVDWGDGITTEKITNANINEQGIHTYNNLDVEKEIKISITGTFESIGTTCSTVTKGVAAKEGVDQLIRIEQWGTTGVKTVDLSQLQNLTEIAEPTESSFKNLLYVSFSGSGITSIPDKMFMNCTQITSFFFTFGECSNLAEIGKNIFEGCKPENFMATFANCTNLVGDAPELWELGTNSEENDYQGSPDGYGCFYNCTNLENYDDIPNYWKTKPEK